MTWFYPAVSKEKKRQCYSARGKKNRTCYVYHLKLRLQYIFFVYPYYILNKIFFFIKNDFVICFPSPLLMFMFHPTKISDVFPCCRGGFSKNSVFFPKSVNFLEKNPYISVNLKNRTKKHKNPCKFKKKTFAFSVKRPYFLFPELIPHT